MWAMCSIQSTRSNSDKTFFTALSELDKTIPNSKPAMNGSFPSLHAIDHVDANMTHKSSFSEMRSIIPSMK